MWFKIKQKLLNNLEKVREKKSLTYWELAKEIWIWRATFYRLKDDKKASARTIRKLKDFLKENGYEVE